MTAVTVDVTDELVEAAAARAVELMAEKASPTEDRWLRGAERIAAYIDAPESRVYSLSSSGRIPVHRDGSALIARTSELDAWVLAGGGKRP